MLIMVTKQKSLLLGSVYLLTTKAVKKLKVISRLTEIFAILFRTVVH